LTGFPVFAKLKKHFVFALYGLAPLHNQKGELAGMGKSRSKEPTAMAGNDVPLCPGCGKKLRRRANSAGKEEWVCVNQTCYHSIVPQPKHERPSKAPSRKPKPGSKPTHVHMNMSALSHRR